MLAIKKIFGQVVEVRARRQADDGTSQPEERKRRVLRVSVSGQSHISTS